jgi:predicted DNA binding CopG/RHH family protein
MRQNITLRLDNDLIRKAKVLAAQRGTPVSGLLTQYLKKVLNGLSTVNPRPARR